ncbi:MAG: hypothetical protein LBI74_02990, partial [Synergistaceae bacterium]|nr:hypothetical protein [Synergistaceae bacterium]
MTSKKAYLYSILGWGLGFVWFLPDQIAYSCIGIFLMVYMLYHPPFQIDRRLLLLAVISLFFLTHLSLTNLFEISRLGYMPFHRIYRTTGITDILGIILRGSFIYVLFRCFREGNPDGRFFQDFAGGMNAFLVVLICFLPSFSNGIVGRLAFSFRGDMVRHPNIMAYMMMLCFYLNFLSCYYVRRFLKAYHILFCIISSIFIFLTLSRAVLVALLTGLVIWICRDKKRLLATSIVIVILIIFYSAFDVNFLPERIT